MGSLPDTQKKKLRAKVPGESLKDKMKHLYLENPKRSTEEFAQKLALTRDQVYGLKHIVKKELQQEEQETQKAQKVEQAAMQLGTQDNTQAIVGEHELPGVEPVILPANSESNEQSHLQSFSELENLLPFDLEQPVQQPIQQYTQQQPTQQQTVQQQPTQHYEQPVQQPVQQSVQQQLVSPPPVFDLTLSDVDGGTIKSFLSLISDKPKPGGKYKLELKLVES